MSKLNGLFSPTLRNIRLKLVAKEVESGKKVLDLGCGDGSLINLIQFSEYMGVDNDKEQIMCNLCKHSGVRNASFDWCNLNEELFLQGKYDVIVMSAVIEHLYFFPKILSNLSNVMEEKCKIIITTPTSKADEVLWFGSMLGLFSKGSLEEHSLYYKKTDFLNIWEWKLVKYKTFELGLNQLIVLEKNEGLK